MWQNCLKYWEKQVSPLPQQLQHTPANSALVQKNEAVITHINYLISASFFLEIYKEQNSSWKLHLMDIYFIICDSSKWQ